MASLDIIRERVQSLLAGSKGSHDLDHTERVLQNAVHIAKAEKADLKIVQLAALLHDIGRPEEDRSQGGVCHAEIGAEMAVKVLKEEGFDDEIAGRVAHCIECHRFRNEHVPQTLEAKVVFDADKLDAIGATGVGRAFLFAGEVGARLHNPDVNIDETEAYSLEDTAYREYMVKLKHVKERLMTAEGKRIAEERHRFMTEFFERLAAEHRGEL